MALVVNDLHDEIRTLRLRDASREREVQVLKSALEELKESNRVFNALAECHPTTLNRPTPPY